MSSRRRLALCLPFLVGFAVLGACSSEEERPPVSAGGSSTVPPGGTTEAGTLADTSVLTDSGLLADGSVCTDLTLLGNLVDGNAVAGDAPTDTGGAVTAGSYNLTDYTVYVGDTGIQGPTGISKRATIRISGGFTIEQIILTQDQTSLPSTQTFTSSYSAVAPTFTTSDTCPVGGAASYGYTASDSTLRLTNPSTKEAFTYTLQ